MDPDIDLHLFRLQVLERYQEIEASVNDLLSSALGDVTRTRLQLHEVTVFKASFEQHQHLFIQETREVVAENLEVFQNLLTSTLDRRMSVAIVQGDEDLDLLRLNLIERYLEIEKSVSDVLRAAVGDVVRMRSQIHEVAVFQRSFEQHQHLLSQDMRETLNENFDIFKTLLTEAGVRCLDPPRHPPVLSSPPRRIIRRNHRGRPRIYLDPELLAHLLENGYSAIKMAPLIGKSCARTIQRRLLEEGLVEPGEAPFQHHENPDGSTTTTHHPTRPKMSPLNDGQLDRVIRSILADHPSYGRTMLLGALHARGHRISAVRLAASCRRVCVSARNFARRTIVRTRYYVAGANSVWHLDGNHKLIRWKMVLHLFIDGKSRVVTGLGVHGNNRSQTVLRLFLSTHREWGIPNHLRGDHGVENVKPAAWMQAYHGRGRAAFIWGKSTHNTRVERIWNDTWNGFVSKWKAFFEDLERWYGLNPDNPIHLWLLHHLFLNSVNVDAQLWKEDWNSHKLSLRGAKNASPRCLWLESQLRDGVRGFDQRPLPEPRPDWEDSDDIVALHQAVGRSNSGVDDVMPQRLNYVQCDPVHADWTPGAVEAFDAALDLENRLSDTKMANRTVIWMEALEALPMLSDR